MNFDERLEKIADELDSRVKAGEISLESAQAVYDFAYNKYVTEATADDKSDDEDIETPDASDNEEDDTLTIEEKCAIINQYIEEAQNLSKEEVNKTALKEAIANPCKSSTKDLIKNGASSQKAMSDAADEVKTDNTKAAITKEACDGDKCDKKDCDKKLKRKCVKEAVEEQKTISETIFNAIEACEEGLISEDERDAFIASLTE